MKLKSYPVKIECYDAETSDPVFAVEAFDEHTANITISTVLNVAEFDVVAKEIRKALVSLGLEK